MKIIIPVAGKAARMRPHTHTKIKPFISVAGKSSLGYIMDELKKFDKIQKKASTKNPSHISEVIFIVKHLKEKVEEFIKANYDFKMRFVEQKIADGPAGAVKLAEEFIDEPVLIIYADTVFDVNLSDINNLKDNESGIIWAKKVNDPSRFGVLVLNDKGYIREMVEKPKEFVSDLANIGMYYMKDYKLFFKGIKHMYENNLSVNGEFFLTNAFVYMVEHSANIICPEVEGWYDTGKPETLLASNRMLLEKNRHKIIETENTVIIPPVHIADGAKIKDSIIGPYATISKGTEINNCIVRNSIISENAKLTDMMIDESLIGEDAEASDSFRKINIGDHSTLDLGKKNSFSK